MLYSKKPIVINDDWLEGASEQIIDSNHSAIILKSGEVLSIQPNGSYETRPPGTFGEYEIAERDGRLRIYTPGGKVHIIMVV